MRRKHLTLLLIFTALALSSCGKESSNQSYGPTRTYAFPEASALNEFPTVPLYCAEGSCPQSVGMLLIKTNQDLGRCTTFVVSDNVMATNNHCIPADLAAGSDCSDRLEVTFQSGINPTRVRCDKILWKSKRDSDDIWGYDLAYYTTQTSTNRRPIEINRAGLKEKELVEIYKVDLSDRTGFIRKDQCKVEFGTMLSPYLESQHSPGLMLTPVQPGDSSCSIIGGNSGSPILSSTGMGVGIIQASSRESDAHVLFRQLLRGDASKPVEFSYGTSGECFPDPLNLNLTLPSTCKAAQDPSILVRMRNENISKFAHEAYGKKLDEAILPWASKYPMFKWQIGVVTKTSLLTREVQVPLPYCSVKSGITDDYKGLLWGYRNNVSFDFEIPAFNLELTSDETMHFRSQITEDHQNGLQAHIEFEPQKIADGKNSIIKLSFKDGLFGFNKTLYNNIIEPCRQ